MMRSGEVILQQALMAQQTLLIEQWATASADVYGQLPANLLADAQNWWAKNGSTLQIVQGWPWQEQILAGVGIVLGPEEEADPNSQPLGESVDFAGGEYDSSPYQEGHGTYLTSTFEVLIVTPNANLVVYLDLFVKWALLQQRAAFSEQGFYDQRLGAQDLEPDFRIIANESIPVFRRIRTLRCGHWETYTVPGVTSTGVSVGLTPAGLVTLEE